jgi:tRNA A37 threonylcarbamoyladenosine dehydratase
LIDGDVVDVTNINRQIIATHKTVGRDKVTVMQERLLEINPGVVVVPHKLFYLPESAGEIDLSDYDYVIDAVDTMAAKLEIVCRAVSLGVPIISSMGAANKLDAAAFQVADIYKTSFCPMARVMRQELRKRGVKSLKVVYSTEPPRVPLAQLPVPEGSSRRSIPASCAFVPPVAGLIMAGEAVKDLLNL